jgi:hypothetical protein
MRETRLSGSEGGARLIPCPYPYRGSRRSADATTQRETLDNTAFSRRCRPGSAKGRVEAALPSVAVS